MVYCDDMKKIIFIECIFVFAAVLMISAIGNNYGLAYAQGNTEFTATLSGKEVVPPVKTDGTGVILLNNYSIAPSDLHHSYKRNQLLYQ